MTNPIGVEGFHAHDVPVTAQAFTAPTSYAFENHFHPYVGALVEQLNRHSVDGLLKTDSQSPQEPFFKDLYLPNDPQHEPASGHPFTVTYSDKKIDVEEVGPYAVYNWELFFHAPLTIAVHLSKNQRFAQAQRWFHYIFDPTSTDNTVAAPQRFWKFIRFRPPNSSDVARIDDLITALSQPDDPNDPTKHQRFQLAIQGYEAIRETPFQPHRVARTRVVAYQYQVVMKYLDNLISWGDSLFRQDTAETINEATQLYVLASDILGPRPQQVPPQGAAAPKTYAQLKAAGLSEFGDALVELEGQFPFNLARPPTAGTIEAAGSLFGIGRSLYFCVPRNDTLLGYWDTVADRLFKIRNCRTIAGVVRPLALFDPPIDPGMLVKAAAVGIDVAALVSGLNQPPSPVRATLLIQKALEIAAEVRGMGAALLAALEKRDGEALGQLRQGHEITIAQLTQDVRFLQWKETEEATEGLLRSRATVFERYRHYQLLLGANEADLEQLREVTLNRPELREDTFDAAYQQLVEHYAGHIGLQTRRPLPLVGDTDPSVQSGAQTQGNLDLIPNEFAELNVHLPAAHELQIAATAVDTTFGVLGMIPNLGVDFHFWGLGGHMDFGGPLLSAVGRTLASAIRGAAEDETYQGTRAAKLAGYQRRDLDFVQQSNQAALELAQNGRQLLAAVIHEQIAHHEYQTHKKQIANAQAVDAFLKDKFTSTELYTWMQGELSRTFYDCYRFAFDVARQAEQTMKHELMRPELDDLTFIKFNYWDDGRRGLLAGDGLYLDLKRMEMAYHDHNIREYELTKHISLQQLNPLALLRLRASGHCEFEVPEWLFDLDTPGHYMRRINSVALSIPAVTGPYTTIPCTLTLLSSSLRRSTAVDGGYPQRPGEDPRFVVYSGTDQVVTSSATNDSGLFEPGRDERFRPFEGAGAISSWQLALPPGFRPFAYITISDVILHLRYTAREGGLTDAATTSVRSLIGAASNTGLARLFSLRHDFSADWYAFVSGTDDFHATLTRQHFPYFAQGKTISLDAIDLWAITGGDAPVPGPPPSVTNPLPGTLTTTGSFDIHLPEDSTVLRRDDTTEAFLLIRYSLH